MRQLCVDTCTGPPSFLPSFLSPFHSSHSPISHSSKSKTNPRNGPEPEAETNKTQVSNQADARTVLAKANGPTRRLFLRIIRIRGLLVSVSFYFIFWLEYVCGRVFFFALCRALSESGFTSILVFPLLLLLVNIFLHTRTIVHATPQFII